MRWLVFAIFAWVLILVQTTVGRVLTFQLQGFGTIGPDFLAAAAVFLALYVRRASDAILAVWVLGLALDLTTAGGVGSATVLGPMALAYCLAGRMVFALREAFFRERIAARFLLTLLFCLLAHGLWVTLQSLLAYQHTSGGEYVRMLGQAVGVSLYSALLAPLMLVLFGKLQNWLIAFPAAISRGARRGGSARRR